MSNVVGIAVVAVTAVSALVLEGIAGPWKLLLPAPASFVRGQFCWRGLRVPFRPIVWCGRVVADSIVLESVSPWPPVFSWR